MLTTLCFCSLFLRTFAHRALCAAAILALPAAEILRLVPVRLPRDPGESGESRIQLFDCPRRPITFLSQLLDDTSEVCHEFPLGGDCINMPSGSRFCGELAAEKVQGRGVSEPEIDFSFVSRGKQCNVLW